MFVQIIDNDLRIGAALEFDYDARVFIRLIADVADIGKNFFVHQLCDPLDQRCTIHAVGNFGNNNLLTCAFEFFDSSFATDLKAAAPAIEILANAAHAADDASGREIRPLHVFH